MSRYDRLKDRALAAAASGLALLIFSGGQSQARAQPTPCEALAGTSIPAARIGLPTGGARITSAALATTGDTSARYCKISGSIAPVDPKAHPVLFAVNLPEHWNHKTLQYGGGGMNGRLVDATGQLGNASPGPTPLERGYATLGTDSGHTETAAPKVEELFLNKEEAENFAFAAYKKLHDVGAVIVADYYKARPAHSYFVGSSEGGREAMVVTQRFGADFDGVIATVPAIAWTGINLATYNFWAMQQAGGWMGPAKVALIQKATLDACDALDGVVDGLVATYKACAAKVNYRALRCPGGGDAGDTCLSDAQIALAEGVRRPIPFKFTAANGQTSYPGFGVGGEASRGGLIPNVLDATRDGDPMRRFGVANARLVLTGDIALAGPLDQTHYAARLETYSQLMDAMDPDLSAFKAHGGKLIMREHGADYVVGPGGAFSYFESLQKKFGADLAGFVRFYVVPGVDHGGSGLRADGSLVPSRNDMLTVLEQWVEGGSAPGPQMVASFAPGGTTPQATLPLCEYPAYPHFTGTGSRDDAASYACKTQ